MKRRCGCFLHYRPAARPERGAATMTDHPKSTFARRVRAAKPRATKYEVRDDVVSGLALAIQPTGGRTYFLARMVRGRRRYATIGSADAMTIPEAPARGPQADGQLHRTGEDG